MSTLETSYCRYEQHMMNGFDAKAINIPIDHYVWTHIVIYRNIGNFYMKNIVHMMLKIYFFQIFALQH